jgi:hypothetical protein
MSVGQEAEAARATFTMAAPHGGTHSFLQLVVTSVTHTRLPPGHPSLYNNSTPDWPALYMVWWDK